MIIIETLSFLILCIFAVISLLGLGQLLINKFNKSFFESLFFGFIVISFFTTFIHFFFKINIYIFFIIFLLGFIRGIEFLNHPEIKIEKKNTKYLLIFLLLIPIYVSQKYHEDFGYYHLPYIINMVNEKIIFGLANLNRAFVHNSIWINIQSAFYIKGNYNFVNLPTFLIYSLFIIFSFTQILKNKKNISSYFLIVSIFYIIIKFTRISEFGNDIPSIIFSILSIYNFLKFYEEKIISIQRKIFFNNLSFALFAILIKFSSIPVIILTLYLFLKNYKIIIGDIFKTHYIFIYFVCSIFFIQQFIYTGCFIFPSDLSCFNVLWFDDYFLTAKQRLELVNKSYFSTAKNILTEEEYLRNFNWVPYWFKRNYSGMLEHLLTMTIPLILFLMFLKKDSLNNFKFREIKFFSIFILFGFFFWLNFSPVYRFGIIYFLSFIFVFTLFIFKNKIFSKKIFLISISLFLFFNFLKNLNRINHEKQIFFGIKKIENNYMLNSKNNNNLISTYRPDIEANAKKGNGWQGRLCWDIKFICTKNLVQISKQNGYFIIKKKVE
jgi:hypothetical protein